MAHPSTVDRLAAGDHVCWTFDDHERHLEALVRFVRGGLERGEQVLYFTDTFLPEAFLVALGGYGVDAAAAQDGGRLRVTSADDSYLAGGFFEPERALEGWVKAIQDARGEGYAGLRVAVDMGWTARLAPGLDRLVSYEREVNRIFSEGYAMALCCYDRRLFTAAELERLGAAHPGTARGGAGTDEEWTPLLRMRREGGVLTLSGEADATNQDALRVMVEDVVESARDAGGHAVIDVSALTFADLAAVRLLAGAVTAGSARLRGAGPWLTDVLALVGVHDPGEGSAR